LSALVSASKAGVFPGIRDIHFGHSWRSLKTSIVTARPRPMSWRRPAGHRHAVTETSDEGTNMPVVISRDGTRIAYDMVGRGPALVTVDGALCSRAMGPGKSLAPFLSEHFTVFTYDRRGRGDSTDTAPYAIDREIEDLDAVITETGGSAFVFGLSSGAALALEAAARGSAITKLVLYEAPFIVDDSRGPIPEDIVLQFRTLLADERRGDAVRLFMRQVGVPRVIIGLMRFLPVWPKLKAVAHTLPYDMTVMAGRQSGKPLAAGTWTAATMPTLVLVGEKSPTWFHNSMKALALVLPRQAGRRRTPDPHDQTQDPRT
jgi:pimeloyl-ACP methyl ester carboxylesterase